MSRFLLVITWIPSALVSIFASIFLLHYLTHVRDAKTLIRLKTKEALLPQNQIHFFAALPEVLGTFSTTISSGDARPEIIRTFLSRYNSPLSSYAEFIVDTADKYNVDYRMIAAVAMQESTGCKFIPEDSYNCWGYGVYGDKVTRFANYKEGIEAVTKLLRQNYIDDGLATPEEIMARYTPPSKGSWARGIEYFLEQMQ